MIFVACCLPPDGRSVIDTVPAVIRILARQVLRRPVIDKVPYAIARFIFGNRASPEQRAEIKRHLCPESTALITGACATSSLSSVPSGWILPLHDRALPPRRQRRFLRGLDRLEQTVTIDAGHEVLITHPEELARCILAMVADC